MFRVCLYAAVNITLVLLCARIEKVEAAAQGRVWMGTTALTLGLVRVCVEWDTANPFLPEQFDEKWPIF